MSRFSSLSLPKTETYRDDKFRCHQTTPNSSSLLFSIFLVILIFTFPVVVACLMPASEGENTYQVMPVIDYSAPSTPLAGERKQPTKAYRTLRIKPKSIVPKYTNASFKADEEVAEVVTIKRVAIDLISHHLDQGH